MHRVGIPGDELHEDDGQAPGERGEPADAGQLEIVGLLEVAGDPGQAEVENRTEGEEGP